MTRYYPRAFAGELVHGSIVLIGEILRQAALRHPEKPAIIAEDAAIGYAALERRADRIANALRGLGLGKGARIALLARNAIDYVAVHFGAARAGLVLVHLSPAYGAAEIVHILRKTAARLIVVEAAEAARILDLKPRLPALRHVVALGDAAPRRIMGLERLIARASAAPPRARIAPTDPFAMTFTGGTTGFPKGALVSHRARIASSWTTALEHGLTSADVVAVVTPLYHAIGLLVWLNAAMLVGATIVLLAKWDPQAFARACRRRGVTATLMVPVQLRDLLDQPGFAADDFATLAKLGCGGAPMPAELPPRLAAMLPGARLTDHYGQSETGPLTFLQPWHPAAKTGSIGRAAVGVDLRLLAPDGRPVAPGTVGEIVVRGDFLMSGYYKDPVETAAYFRKGDSWGWTGDLATMDAEGFIRLAGRSKEMVISGGLNVYPREIELALETHDLVAECAAFGVPDERWGEAVIAYVVCRPGAQLTPEALIDYSATRLARFKRPRLVCVVAAIPKSPSGKILKAELRRAHLAADGN